MSDDIIADADAAAETDIRVLIDVARCGVRGAAVHYAICETVAAGIPVTNTADFLDQTVSAQDAAARDIMIAAEQQGRRGLALAWRLIRIAPARVAWPIHENGHDAVAQAVRHLAFKRTTDAQIARDRLRSWPRLTLGVLDRSGSSMFSAAEAYCHYSENRNLTALPIDLLLKNRWDHALSILLATTKLDLAQVKRTIPTELMSDPRSDMEARNAWHRVADDFADALLDIGQAWSGELSLAWRMISCEPNDPRSFSLILPQLRLFLDDAVLTSKQSDLAEARLAIWHDAACGKHLDADVSIWRIAAVETESVDDEAIRSLPPSWKRDPEQDVSSPHVVVLAEEGANRKSLPTDWKKLIDKRVPLVVAHDVAAITAKLRAEYPHAWREVGMLVQDLRDDKPAWMRPVILLGDPGSGKSRLVRRLAELLSIHVNRHDASSSMDGMFGGVTKGWSSAQQSVPANAVLTSQQANPIVMIDEIEKASEATHNGNLWNALTPLLERETSARYRDKGIDCQLDLSHISYIATANAVERLPAPLRDRFRIIRIPSPTMQHLPALAANVLRDIAAQDEERAHEPPLADDELAIIGRVWARERFSMRKLQRLIAATLEARDACAMRH